MGLMEKLDKAREDSWVKDTVTFQDENGKDVDFLCPQCGSKWFMFPKSGGTRFMCHECHVAYSLGKGDE